MKSMDKLIKKLEESDKLELHAKIMFDLKNGETYSLDRYSAEQLVASVINDMFRANMNIFEKIDMEFID